MAEQSQIGTDLALQSLPNGTVDVVFDGTGNVAFDDSESFRVTSLLVSHAGKWFADPTGKKGSRLHEVKTDRKDATISQLESYATQALVPALGFISNLKTKATRIGSGKFLLVVSYRSRSGALRSIPLEVQS